ncbi:MAG: DinB family protein, partial [Pseudomonadota bacterium]
MITPDYALTMARYTAWQNTSLTRAADTLTDAARWQDRGSFFGSIAATLNHILGDDKTWLARLAQDAEATARLNAQFPHTQAPRDWAAYKSDRQTLDTALLDHAKSLTPEMLAHPIRWQRGPQEVETTVANLIVFRNHRKDVEEKLHKQHQVIIETVTIPT